MCVTYDKFERACGFLLLNEINAFVYCCTRCQCEFVFSPDLEVHILSEHEDEKGDIESVFVNDDSTLDEATPNEYEPTSVKIEQCDENVEDVNEPNAGESIEIYAEELTDPIKEWNEEDDSPLADFIVDHDFNNENKSEDSNKTTDEVSIGGKRRERPARSKKRSLRYYDESFTVETKEPTIKRRQRTLIRKGLGSKRKKIDSDLVANQVQAKKSMEKRHARNMPITHNKRGMSINQSRNKEAETIEPHSGHWPERDENHSRSICKIKSCKSLTHVYCTKCNVHLCFTGERNCFRDYHLLGPNKCIGCCTDGLTLETKRTYKKRPSQPLVSKRPENDGNESIELRSEESSKSYDSYGSKVHSTCEATINKCQDNRKETTEPQFSHWPDRDENHSRSICKIKSCKSLTHVYCTKCNVHLCFTRERNCFRDYHQEYEETNGRIE